MRKKMNRTSVIILIVATLSVAVSSLIVYSEYDRARKGDELLTAIASDNTEKALALLKAGADPNHIWSCYGVKSNVIITACYYRNVVVVGYLLSHGVKAYEDGQGKASLIVRALGDSDTDTSNQCKEIIQMLIDHGADVNAVGPNEDSPLIVAIYQRENEVVKFLVDHGANVYATSHSGNSPLQIATDHGNTFVVRLLLNAGADPSKCGETFDELIKIAQKHGHKETVAILKDAMAKHKAAATTGPKK